MRGMIDHLDLTVRDPEKSRTFYQAVLGFMGYTRVRAHGSGFDFDVPGHLDGPGGDGWQYSVGLRKASGENEQRVHDRYSPGLHHAAFRAQDRSDVDRLHDLLVKIGAVILDAPADYPSYGQTYYAVFFADPDGLKLEFVFQR
jgi:catechol 2,3-dioxygenase-like lactoylglutathione lyase family enzyme